MSITITSVTGLGGSPPTQLLVEGTVSTCERVEVRTSCSANPVTVAIPTGGPNVWHAVLPNDKHCPCGVRVDVTATCTIGAHDTATGSFTIVCASTGACFDNPEDVRTSDTCITSLSKDVRGEIGLQSSVSHKCKNSDCVSLRTVGTLNTVLTSNAPCDEPLAHLLDGKLVVRALATAYEKDGFGRGVHAGDFQWVSASGDEIDGRISGITNGGLVREKPFKPFEKCVSEGILVGRLCGRVVRSENPKLARAQVVATYRFQTTATAKGESGSVTGTLEDVLITPC
jgi:hypothetical protein